VSWTRALLGGFTKGHVLVRLGHLSAAFAAPGRPFARCLRAARIGRARKDRGAPLCLAGPGVRLEPTTLASGRPECRPPRKADRRKPYRVRPPRAMRSRVSIGFRSGPRGRRRGERNGRLPVLQDRFW